MPTTIHAFSHLLMKKTLFSAAALLCSFAALAQAPATSQSANQSAARKLEAQAAKRDRQAGNDAATNNHGQAVSTLAKSTTLTGREKGAAISTLASGGRSAAQGQRAERSARSSARGGNRPEGAGRRGAGRQGGGRPAGAGRGR
jgi:hypothetical protein